MSGTYSSRLGILRYVGLNTAPWPCPPAPTDAACRWYGLLPRCARRGEYHWRLFKASGNRRTRQLTDHRYIFPAGEEDLEQEWFDSNVARLKQILEDIPVKLTSANFSDGQKMVMLDRQHPNSIHLAIRDAVDQKGAGLYDFMIGLTGGPDDYL